MDILTKQLEYGKLYAQTHQFRNHYQITLKSLNRFFTIVKEPYLSLSFGKQSIILAHIIQSIRPQTRMLFLRSWESYYLHNYEDIICDFTKNFPINLSIVYKDNVSWNDWDWKKTRDYGQKDLQKMGDENYPEWDGVIMGLSKDESVARRITCSKNNTPWHTIFHYKDGRYRCTPIQFWDQNDLLAYIALYNIPLLNAYHWNGIQTRTTARITRNCAEMNGLIDLKHRNISNYNIIVTRFPELSVKG